MITKFIEPFVLPPGVFVLLILALGVWLLLGRKEKGSGWVTIALACVLYIASTGAVSELLIRPLEGAYPPPEASSACSADAVVVLGGGAVSSSPAEGGGPALNPESVGRLVYGVRLAGELPLPLVVTGGRPFADESRPSWAEAAARVARELGIEDERLILEEESRTTWENARYVAELDIKNPILVTSAWHMPRSVYSFEEHGMSPIPAPTVYRGDPVGPVPPDFLPSASGLETTATALHEYVGLVYYVVRYR